MSEEQEYIYQWGNNPTRKKFLKGKRVKVISRGKQNSCLVELVDTGKQFITSRNALRKVT